MKEIRLTKGKVALVDDADFDTVSRYRWFANEQKNGKCYAIGDVEGKRVYMHRLLMGFPPSQVDHANGDGLDNRRSENLRVATHGQNLVNTRLRPGRSGERTSQYKGVCRLRCSPNWIAQITVNNKVRYLGSFVEERDAALAYNRAALAAWGEFAQLNLVARRRRVRPSISA